MVLITCPECGRRISSAAEKCPGCGYPIGAILGNKIALAEANAKTKADAQKKAKEKIEQERRSKGLCPGCGSSKENWETRYSSGGIDTVSNIYCLKCGRFIETRYPEGYTGKGYSY